MKSFLSLALLALVLQSCDDGAQTQRANNFETALEAHTGQAWTVSKSNTKQSGYVVLRNDVTGVYHAYNLNKWTAESTTSYSAYESTLLPGDHIEGLTRTYESQPDGDGGSIEIEIYVYGGLRFENAGAASRDLEIVGALRDEAAKMYLTHRFQSEFSLSSARAEELAKISTRYQRLESRRALTDSEKNVFAMNALGVSMTQVERAMKKKAQGDVAEYEDMLDTAARVNRTTPEQVGRFFDEMAGNL